MRDVHYYRGYKWGQSAGHALGQEDGYRSLWSDIFGAANPLLRFDPAWRMPTVVGVAQQIYDERNFSLMPILADALEEAGCRDDRILSHCRKDREHVR